MPQCGNPWLETQLWRNEWGGGNGSVGGSYIVSDCECNNAVSAFLFCP